MAIWTLICLCLVSFSQLGCIRENRTAGESTEPKQVSNSEEDLEKAPEEMLSSFSVSGYTKGGEKQWELEGKSADIGSEDIQMMDVIGKVYGKDVNMTIVADEGNLNRNNNSVHLEKNVKATTDDGASLITDYLDWDAQNEQLTSDAPVWVERGMMQACGTGIIAQPVLNLVQLNKNVTVEMTLQTQGNPVREGELSDQPAGVGGEQGVATVITCDGPLEVEYENNLAIFQDNVKVKDKRGEIFADKMDVYFAKQTEQSQKLQGMEGMGIEKVVAVGNVEIHHGENITYSQKAVYDTDTGKLTLTGQPKLIIYSMEQFSQLMGTEDGKNESQAEQDKVAED